MMITAIGLGIILFLVAAMLHLRTLEVALARLPGEGPVGSATLTFYLLITLFSHLVGAAIFAVGFWFGQQIGLGGFSKEPTMAAMDFYYFSLINITTLGLGDIYPDGHLRFVAGVESLTGFLLISASASYVFKLVRRDK